MADQALPTLEELQRTGPALIPAFKAVLYLFGEGGEGTSPDAVRKAIRAGRFPLPTQRHGRTYMVKVVDLVRFASSPSESQSAARRAS